MSLHINRHIPSVNFNPGGSIYKSSDLERLIMHQPLDANDLWKDKKGNYDGKPVDMPCGEYGGTAYMQIPNKVLSVGESISCWAKISSSSPAGYLFGSNVTDLVGLAVNTSISIYNNNQGGSSNLYAVDYRDDTWHKFEIRITGATTCDLYVDNAFKVSFDKSITNINSFIARNTIAPLICDAHSLHVSNHFNCPVGLYGYENSGNNNHGTPTNIKAGMADNQLALFTYGYERYRHNTDAVTNTDILVPYRADGTKIIPTIANYTKISDHPAVKGSNGVGSVNMNPSGSTDVAKGLQMFRKSNATFLIPEVMDLPDYGNDFTWTAETMIQDLLAYGTSDLRESLCVALSSDNVGQLITEFKNLGVYTTLKTIAEMDKVASKGKWVDFWNVLKAFHLNSQTQLAIDVTRGNTTFLDGSYNASKILDWSVQRNHPVQGISSDRPVFVKNSSGVYVQGDGVSDYLELSALNIAENDDFRIIITRINDSNVYVCSGTTSFDRIFITDTSAQIRINTVTTSFPNLGRNTVGSDRSVYVFERKNLIVSAFAIKSNGSVVIDNTTQSVKFDFPIQYLLSSNLALFFDVKLIQFIAQKASQNTLNDIDVGTLKLL